jgi:hypothetical protein
MNSQMNWSFASMFVFAIAAIWMTVIAGSVGADKIENKFDVSAVLASADTANLPVLHIEDPL